MKTKTQGYICPQTKKQCDDECCISAEDCHIEASFGIVSDCEPPKQETTLEESKNGTIIQFLSGSHSYDGVWFGEKHPFREGAFWWRTILNKWQQERSYSKEEVLQLLIKFYQFNNFNGTIEEWLEQFKNK